MVLDFLATLGTSNLILMTTALVVFIYFFKKAVSIIKNCFFVGIASAIFPVAANKLMGMAIPLNIGTLTSFVMLGLGLYFIFMFGKTVHTVLSVTGKMVSWPFRGSKPKYAKENKPERRKKEDE